MPYGLIINTKIKTQCTPKNVLELVGSWIGIFERIEDGKLSVAKVTFGAEPKDYEVQEYVQKYYFSLKFSPAVDTVAFELKQQKKREKHKGH